MITCPIFASLTTLGCESLPRCQRGYFRLGVILSPELKTELPVKVRGNPWQPRLRTQTQLCFQVFLANVHLNFTLKREVVMVVIGGVVGGRSISQLLVWRCHSDLLLTSPLVNNAANAHLIHSWGGERPIQFMPHIKGLKCSAVMWGRRLSTQSVCQEDHTACYQINAGHMEDRRSGIASKQTRRSWTSIMINWWLCPSQHTATTSWIELLMASLCRSTEKKSAGSDFRGQASCVLNCNAHVWFEKKKKKRKVKCVYSCKSIANMSKTYYL